MFHDKYLVKKREDEINAPPERILTNCRLSGQGHIMNCVEDKCIHAHHEF